MRFVCLVVIMALVGLPAAARELQPGRDDAPADAGAAPTQHPSVGLPSPRAGAYVQLAAVPDFNTALILFAGISAAHPELVGDRPIILFRFDAGAERGLLYQLGIGPAGDDPAALAALCEGLKASGTDCRIRNVPPDQVPTSGGEASLWSWTTAEAEARRYREYLRRYPEGPNAALARQRLLELGR